MGGGAVLNGWFPTPQIESPWKRAAAQKIHPIGFWGRYEAIMVPTAENATVRVAIMTMPFPAKTSPRVRPLRAPRIRLLTASVTHSRHKNHASQGEARDLIPLPV